MRILSKEEVFDKLCVLARKYIFKTYYSQLGEDSCKDLCSTVYLRLWSKIDILYDSDSCSKYIENMCRWCFFNLKKAERNIQKLEDDSITISDELVEGVSSISPIDISQLDEIQVAELYISLLPYFSDDPSLLKEFMLGHLPAYKIRRLSKLGDKKIIQEIFGIKKPGQ